MVPRVEHVENQLNGIASQLSKLISMSGISSKLGCSSVTKNHDQGVQYHLLHSMTWDENGELNID